MHTILKVIAVGALLKVIAVGALIAGSASQGALAQHMLKIPIPTRSRLTPVQRLNRKGVQAVQKNDYGKAEQLFYKAYLYDPSDPFTLNNLGYISELQGQLDRANQFYEMASKQGSSANIDMSNLTSLKGKPMTSAFEDLQQVPMQVNRINVDAMRLLSQGQTFEASALLRHALTLEPRNAFTLNNLGAVDETLGDYEDALNYYKEAANTGSSATVVVTESKNWSGKPVTKMAEDNATRLQTWMKTINPAVAEAALYNRRGVFAVNENNLAAARQDFLHAYSLDPSDAFSLNNRGYVAEMDGDLESAQYFYQKAQQASGADMRVGAATSLAGKGQQLSRLAANSTYGVNGALAVYSRRQHEESGPIQLTPRNGAPPTPPATAAPQAPNTPGRPQ